MISIIAGYPRLTKEDLAAAISKVVTVGDMESIFRDIFINRAKMENVDENGFEEFLAAYRKKYVELTDRTDYNPSYVIVDEMIDVADNESRIKGDIKGVWCAINLALQYYPDMRKALVLKEKLERKGR